MAGERGSEPLPDNDTLRMELAAARDERDLFRSLLLAEEATLAEFFAGTAVSIERLRATLRQPTREPLAFRGKIERLLEIIVAIGVDSSMLHLPTVEQRLRTCEQELREMKGCSNLSGNDLLPVMVLIEDLCSHIAIAADTAGLAAPLVESSGTYREQPQGTSESDANAAAAEPRIAQALRQLVVRVAAEQGKEVSLLLLGMELIPDDWHGILFDVLSQLLRNAVEHGVEVPTARSAQQKAAIGTLIAEFRPREHGGFELNFMDDGKGLDTERIGQVAVERGLLDSDAVANLAPPSLASLIFHNHLTTATEAGQRGIGMNIVRERIHAIGGQIQIATRRGRFTRFHITLPEPTEESAAGASRVA